MIIQHLLVDNELGATALHIVNNEILQIPHCFCFIQVVWIAYVLIIIILLLIQLKSLVEQTIHFLLGASQTAQFDFCIDPQRNKPMTHLQ